MDTTSLNHKAENDCEDELTTYFQLSKNALNMLNVVLLQGMEMNRIF